MGSNGRRSVVGCISSHCSRLRVVRYYPNIDDHVVEKILESGDEGVSVAILEADSSGNAFVQTVEILDSCHDRVSGIVREDLDSHRQSRSIIGCTLEHQFKSNVLGHRARGRHIVGARSTGNICRINLIRWWCCEKFVNRRVSVRG